eukprot:TRINITY_DN5627_c0_g1_i4.p3 TRINITY_DN5627_c0_g1~~TRINITY_DN5627_c0_g1_i4.p3  ORF type:complete len:195 (+),score=-27.99 TRINITY_DN5627_c0_g1_i4:267-851(+)
MYGIKNQKACLYVYLYLFVIHTYIVWENTFQLGPIFKYILQVFINYYYYTKKYYYSQQTILKFLLFLNLQFLLVIFHQIIRLLQFFQLVRKLHLIQLVPIFLIFMKFFYQQFIIKTFIMLIQSSSIMLWKQFVCNFGILIFYLNISVIRKIIHQYFIQILVYNTNYALILILYFNSNSIFLVSEQITFSQFQNL